MFLERYQEHSFVQAQSRYSNSLGADGKHQVTTPDSHPGNRRTQIRLALAKLLLDNITPSHVFLWSLTHLHQKEHCTAQKIVLNVWKTGQSKKGRHYLNSFLFSSWAIWYDTAQEIKFPTRKCLLTAGVIENTFRGLVSVKETESHKTAGVWQFFQKKSLHF